MDIQKWLNNTQHQLPHSDANLEGFKRRREDEDVAQHPHRKAHQVQIVDHARATSLGAATPAKQQQRRRERSPSPLNSSCSIERSSSDHDASIARVQSSNEKFDRRKRHKTREDRYDLHAGPRKKNKKSQDKKSQKKESKHHRTEKPKRVVKPGQHLLKNFTAPNMSGNRLTLHSPTRQGILRHGRASSPQRRRGLPDLTFSEMRFLSRPLELNDDSYEHKPKRRKKSSTNEQEEISAFFTGRPVPLREKDRNTQATKGTPHLKQPAPQGYAHDGRGTSKSHHSRPDYNRSQVFHDTRGREVSTRSRRSALTWPSSEYPQPLTSARLRPASTVAAGDLAPHPTRRDISPPQTTAPPFLPDMQNHASRAGNLLEQISHHVPVVADFSVEPKTTSEETQKRAIDAVPANKSPQERIMPPTRGNLDSHAPLANKGASSPFWRLLRACGEVVDRRASNDQRGEANDEEQHLDRRSASANGPVLGNSASEHVTHRPHPLKSDTFGYIVGRQAVKLKDQDDMRNHYKDHHGVKPTYANYPTPGYQLSAISTSLDTGRPQLHRQTIPDFHFSNPRHAHDPIRSSVSRKDHYAAEHDSHDLAQISGSHCVHYGVYETMQLADENRNDELYYDPKCQGYQEGTETLEHHDSWGPSGNYYDNEFEFASNARYEDDNMGYEGAIDEHDSFPQDDVEIVAVLGAATNMERADEGQDIVPRGFWRRNILY